MMTAQGAGTKARRRPAGRTALALAIGLALPTAAGAQQAPPPFSTQTQRPVQPPQQQQQQRPPANPVRKDPAEDSAPQTSAELRRRIDQLEQQLLDMHVIFGSLESLARPGGNRLAPTAPNSPASADAAQRLDGLEIQMRALASQLDRLEQQLQALQQRAGVEPPPAERQATPPRETKPTIAELSKPEATPPKAPPTAPNTTRPQTVAVEGGEPRDLYLKAYGQLIRQDYAGAEAGFTAFLARHADHDLAGNAQYWLGETYFVRGQFEDAAQAFLKGYQTYGKSQKAPDSLLKLAISLDRLGRKDAACATFGQLGQKFPSAPATITGRAQAERARLGC